MIDLGQNYLDAYIEEAQEQLSRLEGLLLELEKAPRQSPDVLNEIFRIAHTLKGSSATMGFNEIADLTHNLENVFDKLRKNEINVTHELVDFFFECLDVLKDMEDAVARGEDFNGDTSNLLSRMEEVLSGNTTGEISDSDCDSDMWEVRISIDENCVMKAARIFTVVKSMEEYGEIVSIEPDLELLKKAAIDSNEVTTVIQLRDDVGRFTGKIQDIPDVTDVKAVCLGKRKVLGTEEDVKIDFGLSHSIDYLEEIKSRLLHCGEVRLESGENDSMSFALLQLILSMWQEGKRLSCSEFSGPAVKFLRLMGVVQW